MPKRDVVITGLGPMTAFGPGMDVLWDALIAGRSAIARIRAFDPANFPCQVAAEMPSGLFDVRQVVPKSYRKATKVMCRDVELAVGAAAAAVEDARIVTRAVDPDATPTFPCARLGCHVGAGLISADVRELADALVTSRGADGALDLGHWGRAGMANLTPLWLLKYLPNMLACHVTIVHGCQGPSNTITCCEASSGLSLGESMRVIERGAADACLTGGAEYKLNMMAFLRQEFTGRLAPANGTCDPAAVARPFDPAARGTVLGEGGGILVVEGSDVADARGARVYARVAGFGTTQSFCPDTVGLDIPADDPSLGDAIEIALRDGGVAPDEIDAIVPFGSGVAWIDAAEAAAIRRVFGPRAARIPIVTTVPNAGACAAGNGAITLCVGARCLYEQRLPARISSRGTAGLDAAAVPARDAALRHVLVFTPSQGGQNVAVVLARAQTRNGAAA